MTHTKTIGMQNLKNKKLYMQVYDELRDYIMQKQLRPGDMLPTEMEMCATLGVSRNVLREAVKALEITGVVSSKPGVGIVIREFNPDFLFQTLFYNLTNDSDALLKQTLAVRRVLELGFAREAFFSLLPEDIDALAAKVETMEKILQQKTSEEGNIIGAEFSKADADFHLILNSRTKNRVLLSILDAIWHCDRFYKQTIPKQHLEKTVTKHRRILGALKAHDLEAYIEAIHFHFDVDYKPKII